MSTPPTKGLNVDDIVHIKRITSPLDCENGQLSTTHCECKITEIEGTHCAYCRLQHHGSIVSEKDARKLKATVPARTPTSMKYSLYSSHNSIGADITHER